MTSEVRISIHASRREGRGAKNTGRFGGGFQSTLPGGSDARVGDTILRLGVFQSTLPGGSDTRHPQTRTACPYFNPRSPEGATLRPVSHSLRLGMSIHAPRRERPLGCGSANGDSYFNPRSPEGATHHPPHPPCPAGDFNPRSPEGATHSHDSSSWSLAFQSTLPGGSDRTNETKSPKSQLNTIKNIAYSIVNSYVNRIH